MRAAVYKGPHSIEVAERPDGIVGVPHGVDASIADTIVFRNLGLRGGVAPARTYIPELLDDVLDGRINPGRVFDFVTDLDHVAEAYKAMDERRAIKSLIRIDSKRPGR
jgi:threonine dehydrogenase-like Zn-dependent dehydrogenase